MLISMANQMCIRSQAIVVLPKLAEIWKKIRHNCHTMAVTSASPKKDIKVFRKKYIKEEKKPEIGKAIKVKP